MKKLCCLLTICFLLQLNIFAQSGWNLIYNFGEFITDITFIDSLNGLASGSFSSYAKVYKTENGGITWSPVSISGLNSVINNIIFYNDAICFGVGTDGTVIKSTDSGNSWSVGNVGDQYELRKIYASPGGNLFVCQRSGNDIYKSTDEGSTWTKIITNSTGYMYDFGFVNENIGYLVGDSMVKTTDGGESWFQISDIIPISSNLRIKFINENVGFRLANNYSDGKVAKTTDGGNNWFLVYDSNYGPRTVDLTLIGMDTLWAVGYHNIIKSTDSGTSWFHQTLTLPTDFYKTVSVSSLTCFILSSTGGLYKTIDGGLSAPTLVYPNNNRANLPLKFSLSWSSFTSGNYFEIQVSKDSALSTTIKDTLLNALNYEVNNIELNTLYFWRVREKFGDLYSPWSEVWNFKTTAGTPSLTSPSNNSIDVPLTVTFMWDDVTLTADSYQLHLSEDSNFNSVYFNDSTISQNSFTINGLSDSVLYFWRVRAKVRNVYGDWSSKWQFRTLGKTALLLSPVNNSTISPISITLQWSPTSQTNNYKLQVSTDSIYLINVIDQDNIIGLTTIINLDYGGKYFWRVGAKNQDGNTYWSNSFIINTRPKPTTSFPLEIGNKWYYVAGSTRDYYFYGVQKEITDTLSNGFREVTCKYFYTDKTTSEKEYWAYIDGKFYIKDFSEVYYNDYITQDTCRSTGIVEVCWRLFPHQVFGISDTAQVYSEWVRLHGAAADKITIFPEIGIEKVWHYSYFTSVTIDSIYLIGMYRNGEVLGDTIISPTQIFEGDDWVAQPSGVTNNLNAVSFTDRYTGNVVGNNGTILRTTNGGQSWIQQTTGTTNALKGVFFTDIDNGMAVGDAGTILKTTDGGNNWIQQSSGGNYSLYNLYRIDENIAIAIGYGIILRTTDSGSSWLEVSNTGSGYLNGIGFSNASNGKIVCNSGCVLNTNDAGTTWTFGQYDFSYDFYDVSFLDNNDGAIVGYNRNINSGLILKSTNGGQIFYKQSSNTDKLLRSVSFADPNNGIAVGNNGTIVRTTNGGADWLSQPSGRTNTFNDVTFVDSKNGWIVGSGGLILHTTSSTEIISIPILPTNNSTEITLPVELKWSNVPNIISYVLQIALNSTFTDSLMDFNNLTDTSLALNSLNYSSQYFWRVKTISSLGYEYWSPIWKFTTIDKPFNFQLNQNYPNPFNTVTTIDYSIANKQFVKLKIYDLLGKEITSLLNEEQAAGNYSIDFNGGKLASGIYFYRLQAGDFVETKKMIFLK